jgi:hypothetical protein
VGDGRAGAVDGAQRGGLEGEGKPQRARQPDQALDHLAGQRCLQDGGHPSQFGGALADLVHLDVVTVAVPPVGVIAEQHVGVLLAQQGGEPARSLLGVGPHEPPAIRRVGVEDGACPLSA